MGRRNSTDKVCKHQMAQERSPHEDRVHGRVVGREARLEARKMEEAVPPIGNIKEKEYKISQRHWYL